MGSDKTACPENTKLAFIGKQEISEISECVTTFAEEERIDHIEVLHESTECQQKCKNKNCILYYEVYYQKYVSNCKPKNFQQKQLNLCEFTTATKDYENNGYSSYNVPVITVAIVLVISTLVGAMTYLYRRHNVIDRSDTVSQKIKVICFNIVLGY